MDNRKEKGSVSVLGVTVIITVLLGSEMSVPFDKGAIASAGGFVVPALTPAMVPEMIAEADRLLAKIPTAERLDAYKNFMGQIKAADPDFSYQVWMAPDGSVLFGQIESKGSIRVFDADGNVYKGHAKNINSQFEIGSGNRLLPIYEGLNPVAVGPELPPPSAPTGVRGSPMNIPERTNLPGTINGRDYTGHALDGMQSEGFVPSIVENAIETGQTRLEGREITHFDPVNRVRVTTDAESGRVISVTSAGGSQQFTPRYGHSKP